MMKRLVDVLTLQEATDAIKKYNLGYYGKKLNIVLDQEGYQLFNAGLGSDLDEIEQQVHFIGKDYGGVAGFKSAIKLSGVIARCIFDDRLYFIENAVKAPRLTESLVAFDVINRLYIAFIQEFKGSSKWHVWATKFLHFINPNTFPIQDSRVNKCFKLTSLPNSPRKYYESMQAIRQFLLKHQTWLPTLREADENYSWSDLKLIDKVFYMIAENKKCVP
jgi:hypothetical protein